MVRNGYAKAMTDIGKERGWPPMTRSVAAAVLCSLGAGRKWSTKSFDIVKHWAASLDCLL